MPLNLLMNIYLIILDAYTRTDVLKEITGYDNTPFINELSEMGLYIGDCSHSNYAGTKLSLPSVMNLNYLPEVMGDTSTIPRLKSSVVIQTLAHLGYTTIAFENRAKGHFTIGEDLHLSRNPLLFENIDLFSGITEFESMLIETSMLRLLFDMNGILPESIINQTKDSEHYDHFLQTKFILNKLGEVHNIEGPIFVFAHINVPHRPYVFSPTGEYINLSGKDGYRSNVEYLNSVVPDMLRKIIENSKVPPIIIIMGDHGPEGGVRETPFF